MAEHIRGVGYKEGCRCDRCRASHNDSHRRYRQRTAEAMREAAARGEIRVVEGIGHGISGYRNAHCRCDVCQAANKAACVAYRKRRKAAADG